MTLRELLDAVAAEVAKRPEILDLEVQMEGCDCYTDPTGGVHVEGPVVNGGPGFVLLESA